MTNAQRRASSQNAPFLVWTGETTAAAARSLLFTQPVGLEFTDPSGNVQTLTGANAQFSPAFLNGPVTGELAIYEDAVAPVNDACEPPVNGADLDGRVVLVDRGLCNFEDKVFRAQQAGAIAVIIANNVDGPLITPSGDRTDIVIPTLFISQVNGAAVRQREGTAVTLGLPATSGLQNGLVRMFAPEEVQAGSSVSHFSSDLFPDALMEPRAGDLVREDPDLALTLLREIGWDVRNIPFPNLTYNFFAEQNIPAGNDRSPLGDADEDGVINLVEYASGSDPDDPSDGLSLQLVPGRTNVAITLSDQPADLDLQLLQSDNLQEFTLAQGVSQSEVSLADNLRRLRFDLPGTPQKQFFRLRIRTR